MNNVSSKQSRPIAAPRPLFGRWSGFSIMLNRHCGAPDLAGRPQAINNLAGERAGESRQISPRRLWRNGAESCLNRSNRELPVLHLLPSCYLPDTSLLSANNLPVIFPFHARRRAVPFFYNHLKRKHYFGVWLTRRPR
jgi:hypothetical protein